ncbi:hypothetical protein GCM10020000_33900 [Streptomyces olivoverticillatus]
MNTQDLKPARAAAAPTAPRQVARRGAGQGREAEGARRLDRDGDDPVLEGVRGVAGVVLDVQPARHAELAGEVVGLDELGEAGVEVRLVRDVGGDGQQRRVPPDVRRTGLDAAPQRLRVTG